METRLIIKNPNTVVCSELDLLTKLLRRYYDLSLGLVLLICLRMEEDGTCVLSLSLVLHRRSLPPLLLLLLSLAVGSDTHRLSATVHLF